MKLTFSNDFILEVEINNEEKIIKGKYRELTKAEEKEFKAVFKKEYGYIDELQKLSKELNKLTARIEYDKENKELKDQLMDIYDKTTELTEKINKSDMKENTAKHRMKLTVTSDDMDDIINICEAYGYERVLTAIVEGSKEGK
jgi:hypothetical protein